MKKAKARPKAARPLPKKEREQWIAKMKDFMRSHPISKETLRLFEAMEEENVVGGSNENQM